MSAPLLENYLKTELINIYENQPNGLVAKIRPSVIQCEDDGNVVFSVKTDDWMRNGHGVLHGGVMAAIFDCTLGLLSRFHSVDNATPTINLNIQFLRPTRCGHELHFRSELLSSGNTINFIRGSVYLPEEPERILATASASFFAAFRKPT